jgi:homocysteine S-methyltransferase
MSAKSCAVQELWGSRRSALHLPRPECAEHSERPLGASSIGLKNSAASGDPPKLGNYPNATAVFDVDAIGLVNVVHNLNYGLDIGSNSIGASTGFTIAVAANPGVQDMDQEVRRFAFKVEAGAEYAITQPVFDLRVLEFLRRIVESHPGDRGDLAL